MRATGVLNAVLPTQITVVGPSDRESRVHQFEQQFAIVGRSHDCDIYLDDDDVSYRHAYLQVIGGRVLCTDLCSRTGIIWDEGPRSSDWLEAGRLARIGPYRIQLSSPPSAVDLPTQEAVANPLAATSTGLLPRVIVEAIDGDMPAKRWRIDRTLTLIGRSSGCALQLKSKEVSSVHCGLLLTVDGFSVIDMLGKGGTLVNNKPVRYAMLENESIIDIGEFRMRVLIERPKPAAPPPAALVSEATIDTSVAVDRDPSSVPVAISGTEFHKVIRLEQLGSTMVVTFLGDASRFHYADVHRESSTARWTFSKLQLVNVIINFDGRDIYSAVNFTTAAMLARLASDRGGRAMFCNTTERTTRAIETMHYNEVWPRVVSLDEAIRAMSH